MPVRIVGVFATSIAVSRGSPMFVLRRAGNLAASRAPKTIG